MTNGLNVIFISFDYEIYNAHKYQAIISVLVFILIITVRNEIMEEL